VSTQLDYSTEEWKAISGAPVAAGLLITLADVSGPVGLTKEAVAVGKAILDAASGDAPEVVKALAQSARSAGGRPELPDIPHGDRAQTKDALVGVIKSAVGAVQTKSPAEADSYKAWLTSVATKVAHASKEGGFLGIGGTEVSGDEQEALKQLADILGMSGGKTPIHS
jgi:hypothetical protein